MSHPQRPQVSPLYGHNFEGVHVPDGIWVLPYGTSELQLRWFFRNAQRREWGNDHKLATVFTMNDIEWSIP